MADLQRKAKVRISSCELLLAQHMNNTSSTLRLTGAMRVELLHPL